MKQVLVVLICLNIITFTVLAGPIQIQKDCCRNYSKTIPQFKRVKEYNIQENDGRCRIKAVLFKVGKRWVCSDPNNDGVKSLVKKLSKKQQRG
ncbi:eotaxin-like [Carcharodon carcharias]|uniref:eotaxin-like n=1 Tax=Carcharodon carcharias TaxID=13397 RepID=UPI001B7EF1CC|nr:eotaxin-like [Carcharodon carcharias]